MMKTNKMRQYGVITYGNGINHSYWIEQVKAEGYCIVYCDGYCTYWK